MITFEEKLIELGADTAVRAFVLDEVARLNQELSREYAVRRQLERELDRAREQLASALENNL